MNLSIRGIFADAAILWRTDRDLMLPIVGVFMVLPVLGVIVLTSFFQVETGASPEQVREAMRSFYSANIPAVVAISLTLEFGVMLLLSFYLRRGFRVGELMQGCALRLLPWVLLAMANGAVLQLGLALFVIPGLYVFARTWMMGAAYMAAPEKGLFAAISRGFMMTNGRGWWLAFIACGVGAMLFSAVFTLVLIMSMISAAVGATGIIHLVLMLPVAVFGGLCYAYFNMVRIAIFQRLGGSISGI